MNQNKLEYIRTLELLAVIGEEFGEMTKEINNFNWKGGNVENLDNAIKELNQMISPMLELQGLLSVLKLKLEKENVDI